MTPEASPSEKSSFMMTFAQHAWWALCLVWKFGKKLLVERNSSKSKKCTIRKTETKIETYEIEVPYGVRLNRKTFEALGDIIERQALRSLPYPEPTPRRSLPGRKEPR
jgi:hypothetical protein